MRKEFLIYSIFAIGSALMLNSCGGGGGSSETVYNPSAPEDNNQPVVENPQPNPGDILPSTRPEVVETPDGVIVKGSNGNQTLEVFIPNAVVLGSIYPQALVDRGTSQNIKIPVNNGKGDASFSVSGTDPDPYDNSLFIGAISQNKTLNFNGAYDPNSATLITGNFDVFSNYFQVPKDANTNKATLNLNFTGLYNEGENDTWTFGVWDNLNEGLKYQVNLKVDDLAKVSLDSNNNTCPYDFDSANNTIYLPTKTSTGTNYSNTHCIPLVITPGSDDSTDNDSTTVNVYEGNSTTPNQTLVNNQVMNANVSGVYNLTSNLNANETRNLKVEVKANLGGDANKVILLSKLV